MVYYGRSTRARKSFGTKRRGTRSRYRRGSYTRKSVSRLRFAVAGFRRNVEKKYFDKTYQANTNETLTGNTTGDINSNGVTYISNTWGNYSFGAQKASIVVSNDMLKGVETGTTARTRIGNKLKVKYVKGAFTFNAAIIDTTLTKTQGGEALGNGSAAARMDYLRTSYRFVIVKDSQVNSTDSQVTWNQVFDTTNFQAGIHSELNVDNMGRFVILEDKMFTLDADTPQKTCPYWIGGNNIGSVRYNGPSDTALTDKGLYVIWAAFVMGYTGTAPTITLPTPVGHSRLCFTDD